MKENKMKSENLEHYPVWDKSTRIFHWLNLICILALVAVGVVLLNNKKIGVSSDGKILLKTVHVYIGYIFCTNLTWRLLWAFIGNKHARCKAFLPLGKGYFKSLGKYVSDLINRKPDAYLGHNPLARLMVTVLLIFMLLQLATGLVLAGTDLYMPPFGHEIAEWVTGAGEDKTKLEDLVPGDKTMVDITEYKKMRALREPFEDLHKDVFNILLILVALHVIGVVMTEIKEKNGLISAMITGKKVFSSTPVDYKIDNHNEKLK